MPMNMYVKQTQPPIHILMEFAYATPEHPRWERDGRRSVINGMEG